MQFALREAGHVGGGYGRRGRRGRSEFLLRRKRLLVAPEIELTLHEIEEAVLEGRDEGLAVVLEECERRTESEKGEDERPGSVDGKRAPEHISHTCASREVDELPEGQRTEYLVLDLDELRDLELHRAGSRC